MEWNCLNCGHHFYDLHNHKNYCDISYGHGKNGDYIEVDNNDFCPWHFLKKL